MFSFENVLVNVAIVIASIPFSKIFKVFFDADGFLLKLEKPKIH